MTALENIIPAATLVYLSEEGTHLGVTMMARVTRTIESSWKQAGRRLVPELRVWVTAITRSHQWIGGYVGDDWVVRLL
jgi:hypothetical protein